MIVSCKTARVFRDGKAETSITPAQRKMCRVSLNTADFRRGQEGANAIPVREPASQARATTRAKQSSPASSDAAKCGASTDSAGDHSLRRDRCEHSLRTQSEPQDSGTRSNVGSLISPRFDLRPASSNADSRSLSSTRAAAVCRSWERPRDDEHSSSIHARIRSLRLPARDASDRSRNRVRGVQHARAHPRQCSGQGRPASSN